MGPWNRYADIAGPLGEFAKIRRLLRNCGARAHGGSIAPKAIGGNQRCDGAAGSFGWPFLVGPFLNVYNEATAQFLNKRGTSTPVPAVVLSMTVIADS